MCFGCALASHPATLVRGREIPEDQPKPRRRIWAWIAAIAALLIVAFAIVAAVMIRRATPILKGRVIETLHTRFNAQVDLDTFDVSIIRGLEVSGGGLRIYPPAE